MDIANPSPSFQRIKSMVGDAGGHTASHAPPSEHRNGDDHLSTRHDPVNYPAHYTQGAIQCIDAIEAMLGREQFIGYLRGQVVKYAWRLGRKGLAADDAAKAAWYCARLVKTLEQTT